jgi:hypothetical protein
MSGSCVGAPTGRPDKPTSIQALVSCVLIEIRLQPGNRLLSRIGILIAAGFENVVASQRITFVVELVRVLVVIHLVERIDQILRHFDVDDPILSAMED